MGIRSPAFTVFLALSGCGGLAQHNPGGADDGGDDPVSSQDPSASLAEKAAVDDVFPNHGTTLGGTQVTILGGPFSEDAIVWFGDTQAWISSFSDSELLVDSPPQFDGSVNVIVEQNDHRSKMVDAFRYWEDGSDLTGLLGRVSWYRYVGDYWTGSPAPYGYASAFFIRPESLQYWEMYAPMMDSCAPSDYGFDGLEILNPGIDQLTLQASSAADIQLQEDPDYPGFFLSDELGQSAYATSENYALVSSGTTAFPAFEVDEAFNVGDGLQVTSPALSGTNAPTIRRGAFDLEWTPGDGDFLFAALYRWDAEDIVETIYCVMEDDGAFRVPSDAWTGWVSDGQLTIEVGRAHRGVGMLPFNNARSEAVGITWIVGAGFQK